MCSLTAAFAKGYPRPTASTVTEVIDRLLRRRQALEHTALHPEKEAISGLVPPQNQSKNAAATLFICHP